MKSRSYETVIAPLAGVADAPELSRRSFLAVTAGAAFATAAAWPRVSLGLSPGDLDSLDALAQAELVRTKQVSALELVDACIARIERINPQINAVVTTFFDVARAAAKRPLPASPLSGVPYLIKDLVGFKGQRETDGSRMFANLISTDTSPAAAAAVQAGLVVLGKTNTCEGGWLPSTESLMFGAVHNPWNLDYSAGGSSGGAAAAVASGMLPIAHATDAGGSIRMPASCCGVFGLKPSRFRIPDPDPLPGATDVEFCVSRSVRDSAMMLSVSEDRGRHAPLKPVGFVNAASPTRLKIAFCTQNMFGLEPDPEVKAITEDTAKLCASLGHEVIEVHNPIDGERFKSAFTVLWALGPQLALSMANKKHLDPRAVLEPWTLELAALAAKNSKAVVRQALDYLNEVQKQYESFMAPYDAWLTPVLFSPPPRLGVLAPTVDFETLQARVSEYVSYTPLHNAAGAPAMSVPLHRTVAGLPVGSQFAAKAAGEATLLSLAYELERARPWANQWPPVNAVARRIG